MIVYKWWSLCKIECWSWRWSGIDCEWVLLVFWGEWMMIDWRLDIFEIVMVWCKLIKGY